MLNNKKITESRSRINATTFTPTTNIPFIFFFLSFTSSPHHTYSYHTISTHGNIPAWHTRKPFIKPLLWQSIVRWGTNHRVDLRGKHPTTQQSITVWWLPFSHQIYAGMPINAYASLLTTKLIWIHIPPLYHTPATSHPSSLATTLFPLCVSLTMTNHSVSWTCAHISLHLPTNTPTYHSDLTPSLHHLPPYSHSFLHKSTVMYSRF